MLVPGTSCCASVCTTEWQGINVVASQELADPGDGALMGRVATVACGGPVGTFRLKELLRGPDWEALRWIMLLMSDSFMEGSSDGPCSQDLHKYGNV